MKGTHTFYHQTNTVSVGQITSNTLVMLTTNMPCNTYISTQHHKTLIILVPSAHLNVHLCAVTSQSQNNTIQVKACKTFGCMEIFGISNYGVVEEKPTYDVSQTYQLFLLPLLATLLHCGYYLDC